METSLNNISQARSPRWCFNGHVHTIARSLLRNPKKPATRQIEITTHDDDFLELDVIDAQNDRAAIALFHGLEGSSDRYYIVELMHALKALDYSVVAVNFRGCGTQMNRKRQFYHSGQTQDLETVFSWMHHQFPDSPLGAVGFSLGGNVLLKSLGETGNAHPLQAAVAVSVPYNLRAGSLNIAEGVNRIYQYHFLRSLTQKLKKKKKYYPNLPNFTGRTLYDFDNQITAPIHDFENADDYYEQCSSGRFLSHIERPTLLIHSRQDPICKAEIMPLAEIKKQDNLDYVLTDQGGHVGFWKKPHGWLNQLITNYFDQKFG